MKTWLCETISNLYMPTQGVARLYAYIKKAGHDVSCKDFNQKAYLSLLSRSYLEEVLEKLKYMVEPTLRNKSLRENMGSILLNGSDNAMKQLLARSILFNKGWHNSIGRFGPARNALEAVINSKIDKSNIYYALLSNGPSIISKVEEACKILDKDFFNLSPELFLLNFRTLLCGKAMMDALYFPVQLDFGFGFHGTMYGPCASDICRAVSDERFNFLIPYFSKEAIPMLQKEQPSLVGISITHTSEFIPAFTLARLIKSENPKIHICLGGSTLTEIAYRIRKNPSLWDFFDSMILGPGEYAFSKLIEHVEKDQDLSTVPNLIYKEKGSTKQSESSHEFDLNDACCPEYVSLRPKSPVALETSSGCYWGRCIFCYYPKMGLSDIDTRSQAKTTRRIELVLDDMMQLYDLYDPSYISITDSSIHPVRLKQIAEHNIKSKKNLQFSAFIRFEKEFKSKDFCKTLSDGGLLGVQIGLESGSQRTNDIINKGVNIKDAGKILKNFYDTKILAHLYTIVGVPGERTDDALMTYKFLKKMRKLLTLGWQIYSFYVLEHGPIAKRADEFGITARPLPDDFLIQVMMYDVKAGLTQEDSAALSIEYQEKLKRYTNPLVGIMDIETFKGFVTMQKAKGIDIAKIRNSGISKL